MDELKQHWEKIYSKKGDLEVSWYQKEPRTSLGLVEKCCEGDKSKSIADIGGGNSLLVSKLTEKGYSNVCVMDISARSLERSRERVPDSGIKWIEGNILECDSLENVNIWHDRAVFHFLTRQSDVQKYVAVSQKSIVNGGYLILGTFSESGPDKCSGLPVTRYSKTGIEKAFGTGFRIVESFEETHKTPFETEQDFVWAVLKRTN